MDGCLAKFLNLFICIGHCCTLKFCIFRRSGAPKSSYIYDTNLNFIASVENTAKLTSIIKHFHDSQLYPGSQFVNRRGMSWEWIAEKIEEW